jgi:hypothetical protein
MKFKSTATAALLLAALTLSACSAADMKAFHDGYTGAYKCYDRFYTPQQLNACVERHEENAWARAFGDKPTRVDIYLHNHNDDDDE